MSSQSVDLGLSARPQRLALVLRLTQQGTIRLALGLGHGVVPLGLGITGRTAHLARSRMSGILGVPVELLSLGLGLVGKLVGSDFGIVAHGAGVVAEFVGLGSGFGGDLSGLLSDFGRAAEGYLG